MLRFSGLLVATSLALPAPGTALDVQKQCIAIVLPTVHGVEGSAADVGSAVRDLFSSFLTGPAIQVVALDTRLASQAGAEAKEKSCNYLLVATLTRKRGGSGTLGRIAGQVGSSAAYHIPGASTVGGAVARSAATAAAQAANEMASGTRAKDELRLEYRLTAVADGKVVIKPKEEKAKATVDGEDLLTPLVQKASETIATTIIK